MKLLPVTTTNQPFSLSFVASPPCGKGPSVYSFTYAKPGFAEPKHDVAKPCWELEIHDSYYSDGLSHERLRCKIFKAVLIKLGTSTLGNL